MAIPLEETSLIRISNELRQMRERIADSRGKLLADQLYRLNAALAGSNATGAQSLFGVGVQLGDAGVYRFEIVGALSKSAGTTAHTIAMGFGGTATINNINWEALITPTLAAPGTAAAASLNYLTAVTSTVLTGSTSTASVRFVFRLSGTVSVNAAGTFTPQYTLSAAPGGAYSTEVGSIMTIARIGQASANVSVGAWI